jgi:hypothetical protein
VVLVGAGVRVAVDSLQCPFNVLECHLLFLLIVILLGNLLLALLGPRGHAVMAQLLLRLLTKLLHKLLDFPALLCAVAPGVVHWALWTTLVTARGLSGPLVAHGPQPPLAAIAVVVGAPASGLLLPPAFFFFVLILPLL